MKQSNELRLKVEDGISYLIPEEPATCAQCAACNWSAPIFVRQCTIVTEKELFNAKGWLAVCMYVCSFVFMCVYLVIYVSSVCKGISALSLLIFHL